MMSVRAHGGHFWNYLVFSTCRATPWTASSRFDEPQGGGPDKPVSCRSKTGYVTLDRAPNWRRLMRRFAQALAAFGILVLVGFGGHEMLVSMASGDGSVAQWSAGTCASCHGGASEASTPGAD